MEIPAPRKMVDFYWNIEIQTSWIQLPVTQQHCSVMLKTFSTLNQISNNFPLNIIQSLLPFEIINDTSALFYTTTTLLYIPPAPYHIVT